MYRPDLSFKKQRENLAQAANTAAVGSDMGQTLQSASSLIKNAVNIGDKNNTPINSSIDKSIIESLLKNDFDNQITNLQERLSNMEGSENYSSGSSGSLGNISSPTLVSLLNKYEGAGNYDTLFGHSQRDGGRFAGTKISNMSIADAIAFSSPDGEYGQWVKSELARTGQTPRIATPMGAGQIVGSTLRNAVKSLGLNLNDKFDANTQNKIIEHLARQRVLGSNTPEGRRAGLRAEWEGFKNVPDHILDTVIADLLRV